MAKPRTTTAILMLLLAGGLKPAFADDTPMPRPVDPRLLRGRTLHLDEFNCAIDAPGDEWTWLDATQRSDGGVEMHMFACLRSRDGLVMTLGVPSERAFPSDDAADEFLRGVARGMEHRGATTDSIHREPSRVPREGSWRWHFDATGPDGTPLHSFGYLVITDRLYVLMLLSPLDEEPEEFVRFVRSFRFLRPPPEMRPSPLLETVPYFAILFFCGFVGWVANRAVGRPLVNGARVALWLMAILGVSLSIRAGMQGGVPPNGAAHRAGEVCGSALVPMFVAWLVARDFAKKRGSPPNGGHSTPVGPPNPRDPAGRGPTP